MKTAAMIWPLAIACAIGACGELEPKDGAEAARGEREKALAQRLKAACSSQATYDRLKQIAFDEAIQIRNADPVNLDLLSTDSLVRVENPVVKSRDETLDVTVCSGRFVLQVPPGAERAFDGKQQLVADIEYAAQAAADGSGLVYQIKGAEPIIYRLATFDLKAQAYRPAAKPTAVASASPPSPPRPSPTPTATPQASPSPAATRAPAPSRAAASSPSFSCRAGRSRSEQMVCSSERLASLDRQMSSQFYSELSRGDERTRAELRQTRDSFLAVRERCADDACVERVYVDRMAEIRDIAGR